MKREKVARIYYNWWGNANIKNRLLKKYQEIAKNNYDSVSVHQVINDISYLLSEARIQRLPKKDR